MGKKSRFAGNLLTSLCSLALCLVLLETTFRIFHVGAYDDYQINNPYRFIEKTGNDEPFLPFNTYRERVPLRFDHLGYYAPSDGLIEFHSNQFGARWTEPASQNLEVPVILVLGDSFTYGHGLRYEDAYIYRLQKKLRDRSMQASFINLSERGSDAEGILQVYLHFKDRIPHQAVLYGLHINDLIKFTTNYVITNPLAVPWLVDHSRAFAWMAGRFHRFCIRRYRIRQLTDAAIFSESHFKSKLLAVETMAQAAAEKGTPFYVALLPILVDLRKGTFTPTYDGIREALDEHGIACFDLSHCLDGWHDRDAWILPFD